MRFLKTNNYFNWASLFFSGVLLILSLGYANPSLAACKATYVTSERLDINSAVVVPVDLPVGATIYSTSQPFVATMSCTKGGTYYLEMLNKGSGAVKTAYPDVYATDAPGIGLRIKLNNYYFGYPMVTATEPVSNDLTNPLSNRYTLELVKTASLAGSKLDSNTVAKIYDQSKKGNFELILSVRSFVMGSCSLSVKNLVFPIGNVPNNAFTGVNTTPTSAQNTQRLTLNCNQGTNMKMTLSGTQNPDTSNASVLALTGQGSADVASGVGLQIVYNGAPLVLNNKIALQSDSPGGQQSFDLTARYYQTKAAVTMGKANSTATLNITYE